MHWFRQHCRRLLRLTLGMWVLAVAVMAFQGCLVRPDHNLALSHTTLSAEQYGVGEHTLHASGCLQHCVEAATVISPAAQTPAADFVSWAILLLLPALMLLTPAETFTFAVLALRRPAPSAPPARLIFVRFND